MSGRVVERVPVGSKPAECLLQRTCEYIGLRWDGDKVDMVRHQAVADQCYPVQFRALPKQIEIDFSIRFVLQDKALRVAA
jgi:hypothetical protein